LWIVVGLGNHGRKYARTRHNAGIIFVKRIAREWNVKLKRRDNLVKTGMTARDGEQVLLVIPQTYMNQSGVAVRKVLNQTRIQTENLIVAYDDLDIPLGEIRIRREGGPGTHKGMKSIVQEIESEKFPRIRIGIGPQESVGDATSYVLSVFEKREKPLLEKSLDKAKEAVEMILAGEIEKAMNAYNKRKTAVLN